MLTQPRSASIGRASTAVAVALALAACATQLDPPVLVTSPAPPDTAEASAPRFEIEINSTDAVRITQGAQGEMLLEAPEVVMRVVDHAQGQGSSIRARRTGDSVLFEGNASRTGDILLDGGVQMTFANVSISASRALVRQEPNGGTVLTLNDAKLVRAATSAE